VNRFYFFIIIFIAHATCIAMEKETNILAELTTTENPCFAQYLTNNRAVIMSAKDGISHGYDGLNKQLIVHIVDTENNQVVKKVINEIYKWFSNTHLAVHPNKQKFAISFANQVTVYNAKTGEEEWHAVTEKSIDTATFSPIENSIFITHNDYGKHKGTKIVKYNYVTNKEYKIYDYILLRPDIALHPTQPIVYAGNHKGKLFFHSSARLFSSDLSWEEINKAKTIETGYTEGNYGYNHDGSLIVAHGDSTIYIAAPAIMDDRNNHPSRFFTGPKFKMLRTYLNKKALHPYSSILMKIESNDNEIKEITPCKIKTYFKTVIFYPQSLILTILLHIRYSDKITYNIKYWDILTQKCIHTTPIIGIEKITTDYPDYVDLSFSPDCTKLLITLKKRCMIVPVPLNVQEQRLSSVGKVKNEREQLNIFFATPCALPEHI
jgi:hypothetical protein